MLERTRKPRNHDALGGGGAISDRDQLNFSDSCLPIIKMGRCRFYARKTGLASDLLRTSYMTSLLLHRRLTAMKVWPVQDAKARFSELLDTCLKEGPQLVTRRGQQAAVLVPVRQWQRLAQVAKPTLKDLLLSDLARSELQIPSRGKRRRRTARRIA
jgi:antitoxin Phd